MTSERSYDRRRRRSRERDDGELENSGRGRHRTDAADRSTSSADRHQRRRSQTPESRRRRSRDRQRDKDRRRDASRERYRDREQDSETARRQRRRRSPDAADRRASGRRAAEERTGDERGPVRQGGPLPSQGDSFAIAKGCGGVEQPKEKANFGNTGLLAAASNSVTQADGSTIILKYHEPPEARRPSPKDQWRLFVFKGEDIIDTIDLGGRSCWLVGRDMAVVDLPAEHPSVSKQHAAIQFRYTEKRNEFGEKIGRVKPYVIDLESANGTRLNKEEVPDSRYMELRDKDMLTFGLSTREYVLMLAPRE